MFKYYLTVFLILSFTYSLIAQETIYTGKYRTADNPHYWKNDLPTPDYWQQDVSYKIKAKLNDQTNVISGEEELSYWNNSPDTLYQIFFHLYQNAFQPGSYCHSLYEENDQFVKFGPYEQNKLGTIIESFNIYDNEAELVLDNSILRVNLRNPVLPGENIVFDIKFKTFFDKGSLRRRMKMYNAYGYKHFNGVLWYPRISVYDRKFGWTTDQHLGHEFYGDFGDFDVQLDLPHHYILDATGVLKNRNEVLPKALREKLDIKNFKDKVWESTPSIIIPIDSTKRKIWKFFATNVHDFAWTADPTYRIGETEWNGIKCIALVQEPHAAKWQNAAEFTSKVIQSYSTDIGMYAYPKMIVADAKDGMEYPMLTLDGGSDPGYRGLLAHEIAHNWFYGMIGTNETYRAALDEGFTQFLTTWSLERIDGKHAYRKRPKNWYVRQFKEPVEIRYKRAYSRYFIDAQRGLDPSLLTHSDDFGGAIKHGGGYGHVYYKTATMLYNLRYVLGDELFLKAFQHYFEKWKIGHPYIEDFRTAIIEYTKMDLNWFFDQWFETSKVIDYKIKRVKSKGLNKYRLTFERKGDMQMPIDFFIKDKDDSLHAYHIPNKWYTKPTKAKILPKWEGWGNINKQYSCTVEVPQKLKDVIIDTSLQLGDVYCLNNKKKFPFEIKFDSHMRNNPKRDQYQFKWRPDIWYNSYDGIKTGLHINGQYMNHFHQFNLNVWHNSRIKQVNNQDLNIPEEQLNDNNIYSFRVNYTSPIRSIGKEWYINFHVSQLDGLHHYSSSLQKKLKNKQFGITATSMFRPFESDLNYLFVNSLLSPESIWKSEEKNNHIGLFYKKKYKRPRSFGSFKFYLRHPSFFTNYDYKYVRLVHKHKTRIDKLLLITRSTIQFGEGNNVPNESALYLGGASLEDLSHNKYTRSPGIIPNSTAYYNNGNTRLHMQGGLNLRTHSGLNGNNIGLSGSSINIELEFDGYIKELSKDISKHIHSKKLKKISKQIHIDLYLFADAGGLSKNAFEFQSLHYNAGLGMALTIKKFWLLQTVKPLTLRIDYPIINDLNQTQFILFGINRAI